MRDGAADEEIAGREPAGAGRRVPAAAALGNAPMEVLDFLLPLWAGSELRAGASVIGVLIAAEAVLSLVFRPVAGELSDRLDPRRVAAAGAVLYALSFAGYALADGLPVAFAAAALGGAGGALFWVALDAFTGRRAAGDGTAAYGALLTASGKGAFVGYAVAFTVLENAGYRPLFWAGCGACAVAAALLARDQGEGVPADAPSSGTSEGDGSQRRLLPLMGIAAVTPARRPGCGCFCCCGSRRSTG
ncbi:MFS transporter [Streptomyces sp. SBST2-5]|uniref:MFS transporter n=1 Tax=Streptomyces composti TaxID=2720025 RepID=A0ABX1A735_9ACTN|nr:MFS transporter [Streptomyces composti]NJP50797.1 MFS transporter [Streptomyces composti]